MSADIPDPRTLASAEDAFKYPIVNVRGMEKKLRRDMDENHEKLRTLVGASYRDLLDTARTIIDVNGQMERVEKLLVDIGRRSDSRILDKIATNHAKLEKVTRAQDTKQLALASQLSVLQKCLHVILRLLKNHGPTLLVAKLLVIARLLHKTTSSSSEALPLCETLGGRLTSLRQRLLRHIDRRLAKRTNDPTTLVEDMTAFSLATSSTPSDVLKHFQHLRLDAICRPIFPDKENIKESIIRRIQLFLSTIRDSSNIYPEVFAASLRALGARPLVEDVSVTEIDELSFDIHSRWFASDVKNYAPYTRHNELNKSKAEQMFSAWSSHASTALIEQICKDVADEADLRNVVDMRRETLQLWLSSRRNARGLDWNRVFDDLRAPFIQQITHLVGVASAELHDSVCNSILSNARKWNAESTEQHSTSLWDVDSLTTDFSDGALAFRKAVVEKRCGRYKAINQLLETYDRSAATLDQVHTNIRAMKDTRWEDNDGDFDDDDNNVSTSNVLSKRDPDELQGTLHQRLFHTVEAMQSSLSTRLREQDLDCSAPSSPGLFVIRALRELRQQLPQLLERVDSKATQLLFSQDLIVNLQCSLADAVTSQTEPAFETALQKFVRSKHQVQSLWAGTPSLPVQPTPATFRHLRAVVKQMEALGQDLWSLDVVNRLRQKQAISLGEMLQDIAKQLEEQDVEVEESKPMPEIMEQQPPNNQEDSEMEEILETKGTEVNGGPQEPSGAEPPHSDIMEIYDAKAAEVPKPQSPSNETPTEISQTSDLPLQVDQVASLSNVSTAVPTEQRPKTSTSETETETETEAEAQAPSAPEPTTTNPLAIPKKSHHHRHHQTKQKQTQLLFDTLYLSEAFFPSTDLSSNSSSSSVIGAGDSPPSQQQQQQPPPPPPPFATIVADLLAKAQVDGVAEARVRRNAREYWRRTYLLFGLLVAD